MNNLQRVTFIHNVQNIGQPKLSGSTIQLMASNILDTSIFSKVADTRNVQYIGQVCFYKICFKIDKYYSSN